ncbi:nitroreductase [Thauera sp. CAU 1555]|uniref:Nitroreductase n=1 Tax=Thauera sedimentorum TaxID=2767595 RepID=A0ABR9B7M3_9RHOO|nr:nitroreductase [Thauera sedimentorum]MBC9071445.1 nitroreductase [Thauera sedimentorum]MBD8502364.1 nitroreductase [Thauera sedimentorum]
MNAPDPVATVSRIVDQVMIGRRSIRRFLPDEVGEDILRDILNVATRAPSGTNIQPWRVHVLTGATLGRVMDETCKAFDVADGSHTPEYDYYPPEFFEPYLARRRKVGWDLYGLLGIAKGDGPRMKVQHRRNFEFFGAPVGLMFTIDRRLGKGSWLDYGMFLQNVMLAADARGLGTCPQAAWIDYHRIIEHVLDLPPNEQVVCAIALGHPDPHAPENTLVSERAPLEEVVVWHR